MTKDWEPLREEIRRLYMTEEKPLDEVMRLIRGKYDFIASERSYRTQLRNWGYMKYSTQAFPKPNKGARASNRLRRQPAAVLSNPEAVNIFPGETSLTGNLPAFPAPAAGRDNLFFTTPHVPSVGVSAPQLNALDHEIQASSLFHLGQSDQDGEGKTQLHRAALSGDIDQVRLLLNAGVSVETQDHSGDTPLHCGVAAKNCVIIELILKFGANIDAKNYLGRTPLHLAFASPSIVQTLVKQGADPSIQDEKGDTPLHLILSDKSWGESDDYSVDTLLKAGADINKGNKAQITPFLQLLVRPYSPDKVIKAIRSFLEAGGSAHRALPDGRTPLQIFLSGVRVTRTGWDWSSDRQKSETDILRHFLAKGASVITPMPSGRSLMSAYIDDSDFRWRRDRQIGRELLKRLTSDEMRKYGDSFLLEATFSLHSRQRTEILTYIQVLLDRGADPNHEDFRGKTCLMHLLKIPKTKLSLIESVLVSLLEHGADPWQQDYDGTCALFEAATRFPEEKVVRMILKADFDREKSAHGPNLEGPSATRKDVWDEWQQAGRAADWNEAKELILREPNSLAEEVSKVIRDSALAVLAEKHVHLAKDKFQGDDNATELRRKFVAGIFRDCRQSGVIPDVSCTDYLIELCL